MSRIPTQTLEDAPEISRASLESIVHVEAITSLLAVRSGWTPDEVSRFSSGLGSMDEKLDSLLDVVADAAGRNERVEEDTWNGAVADGGTPEQLAETFAYFGIALYSAYFTNFAETELDVPSISPTGI